MQQFELSKFKWLSAVVTLCLLCLWYANASEIEPWSIIPGPHLSSRVETLQKIADSANRGYYFQLTPKIPMENLWEDPGIAFLMVWGGIFKHFLHLGPINPLKDVYRLELFVLLLPLCLIFFTHLFDDLPKWYWLFVPAFFLLAMYPRYHVSDFGYFSHHGLLYLSASGRWVKFPSAFWTFTVVLQFFKWYQERRLAEFHVKRIFQLLVYGLLLGIFISIRKDAEVSCFVGLTGTLLLLGLSSSIVDYKRGKQLLVVGLVGLIVLMGSCIFRGTIELTWFARDHLYSMEPVPRIYGHPTWHSLYAALGYQPNQNSTWGDAVAWKQLTSLPENKHLIYGTQAHEKAARKLYFNTISHQPVAFLRGLLIKACVIGWIAWKIILLNTVLFFFVVKKYPRYKLFYIILLVNTLSAAIVPVFVVPDVHYALDFLTFNYCDLLVGTGGVLWYCIRDKIKPTAVCRNA